MHPTSPLPPSSPPPLLPHPLLLNPPHALQEERQAWELQEPEDRPPALPTSFPSLRAVPAYDGFIQERFERCLDLYLCPRTRRRRPLVQDPESLVPQLPAPRDLRPFPARLSLRFTGHTAAVRASSVTHPPPSHRALSLLPASGSEQLTHVCRGRLSLCPCSERRR